MASKKPRTVGYFCAAILTDEDGDPILDDEDRPQQCGKNHPTHAHSQCVADDANRVRPGYVFSPRITKRRR